MECIILAGGLGTRLSNEVPEWPKCMAPVNGKPFLEYLCNYLESQFVDHVILSLGYKHEMVTDWMNSKAFTFKLHRVIEQEPLGTGGGVRLALHKSKEQRVFVLNGDTLFNVDLRAMEQTLQPQHKAVVALKPMKDFDRYGSVQLDEHQNIEAFEEKGTRPEGLINGGVYLFNKHMENFSAFPDKFSMEKDFLEPEAGKETLLGFESDAYFIDIGIPEDYRKAQEELLIESGQLKIES
jgi:D-glycero-alpha-D-manno-heptose 1-phosphate guanylyltransferase